ncbi:MAG: glycosyltransferase family 39 protein [bacterium]|nr:glycosyltransferase family 39 protein [bacterium]
MTAGRGTNGDVEAVSEGLPKLHRPTAICLVTLKVVLHIVTISGYGYFRDELYFLDCGRHLDWGYVDCAPLVAIYAKIGLLLGGSLPAIRLLPLLAGGLLVWLTMMLAREMGGGRFAQALAGLSAIIAPAYLASASFLSMNVFEPLFWMGCIWVVLRIYRTGDSRLWIWFGVLAGLGLENKHSTVFFGVAVVIALLLTPLRREFAHRWIWLGAGVALLLFLPNMLWQIVNGFPTLEDLTNVKDAGKNVVLAPVDFIAQQILLIHPATFPIWLAGLVSLLVGRLSRFRVVGLTYLALLVLMIVLHAKNYYLAPIYPMLLAAGSVRVEAWLEHWRITRAGLWPRAAVLACTAVLGAVLAPLALPLLSPVDLVSYQEMLGVAPPRTEVAHSGPLPQHFGDRFGWEELVEEVAEIYWSLPEEERSRTGIYASNYGEAGAINLFGPAHGLPSAISGHQNHWLWGTGDFDGDSLIWLQWRREWLEGLCGSVEQAGEHFNPWGMAEENRPIHICRELSVPLEEMWHELKHWN